MPFQDFREFLDALRKQGELFDVDRPVALKFEVAKALRKSAAIGGSAFLFKNNGTDFPLVGGVYNSIALDARTGSAIGIDATYPFGAEIKSATEVPAAGHVCGPAVSEHGHEFFEVAAVPGWSTTSPNYATVAPNQLGDAHAPRLRAGVSRLNAALGQGSMRQKGEPWRGGLRLRPLPRALGPPAAPPPCAVARLRQSVSGEWSLSTELVERRALDGYAALRRPTPTRD